MKKLIYRSALLLIFTPFVAFAINVGEITSMMPPEESILSKEVTNTTDAARYVSIKVSRLSSPMADGIVIPMESGGELLSTPASVILPGEAKDIFRFIYNGPEDAKERYYRLTWSDEPLSDTENAVHRKAGEATTSALINTILVVGPRKENFDFKVSGDNVMNTGNAAFRVISFGPCRSESAEAGKTCRERYYVMPGSSIKIKYTNLADAKTRIGIWHGKNYINVR